MRSRKTGSRLVFYVVFALLLLAGVLRAELIEMNRKSDEAKYCRRHYKAASPYDEGIQFQLEFEGLGNDCTKFGSTISWSSSNSSNVTCQSDLLYDTRNNNGRFTVMNQTRPFTIDESAPLSWKLVLGEKDLSVIMRNGKNNHWAIDTSANSSQCWIGDVQEELLCYNIGFSTNSEDCGMRLHVNLDRYVAPTTPPNTTTTAPPTTTELPLIKTWWFWHSIGGAVFIILVVIGLAIACACIIIKRRRKKRAAQRNGEAANDDPEAPAPDTTQVPTGGGEAKNLSNNPAPSGPNQPPEPDDGTQSSSSSTQGSQYLAVLPQTPQKSIRAKKMKK